MSGATAYRTVWALCDQGIVSAGNFCTNLILIRHLPAHGFGVYALLLNALLFLNNIHAAMVSYTICIRGAQAEEGNLGRVATGGLASTVALSVLSLVAVFFATSYTAHRELLFFVLTASLCWQLQEVLRTVFISHLRYERAIGGDAVSYIGQAAVLAVLSYWGDLSLRNVFLAIMGTSLVAAAIQAIQIRPKKVNWDWVHGFGREIWSLGKWSVLAKLVAFFSLQAFPWVLAYRHGLVSVASFQSIYQLVALSNPILLSANNLIMASIAKDGGNGKSAFESAKKYMLYAAAVVGLYFAVLLIFGGRVMGLFYGRHSTYIVNAPLLRIFVSAYVLEFVSMFAGAILAGMERTRPLFIQQLWGMLAAFFVVLPWIAHSGLFAAVTGLLLVNLAKAISGWWMVYALDSNQPAESESIQETIADDRTGYLQHYDDTV